jgi:flavin-dependent dehydrogenase
MKTTELWDTIVIGGGPAGSASAGLLSKKGQRVLILEKQSFPRFHIGESLLPFGNDVLHELGIWEDLKSMSFMRKLGAEFVLGNSAGSHRFWFGKNLPQQYAQTFQVERAKFDKLLLEKACSLGAHHLENATVEDVLFRDDSVEVTYLHQNERHQAKARYCVDASGRTSVVGRSLQLKKSDLGMPKKIAVFSHFHHVHRNDGEAVGHITIVRIPNGWFWLIPLDAEKTSVGLVQMLADFKAQNLTPEESFNRTVQTHAELLFRMKNAKKIAPFYTEADYTFRHNRAAGPRWLLAGDAAGFIDPIFSSGVMVALRSGRQAAHTVLAAAARNRPLSWWECRRYTRKFKQMTNVFYFMIRMFYDRHAFEVFMNPSPLLRLPAAVTNLVAGNTDFSWPLFWRVKIFFLLCRLQRWIPISPSLSYKSTVPSGRLQPSF